VAYPNVQSQPKFPAIEETVSAFWAADQTFEASVQLRSAGEKGNNEFVFYDGPPFDPTLLSTSGSITNTNGRSEMFFLTQEASATNCSVRFLTIMYCSPSGSDALQSWDAPEYAESLLLERIIQVLDKFLESEKMCGKLLDPKVWQSSSDSGRNIAVYCTSFARVVVTILNSLRSFSVDQFDRHKKDLYPIICSLIRVQSDEIRELVTNLMTEKSSAFIGT
jgi:hypothetical protein